jgi:hypothetical protein
LSYQNKQGQTIGYQTGPSSRSAALPRTRLIMSAPSSPRFQFTIGTLLASTVWAALVAWGLARAGDFAYSVLFLVMLVMMFTSIVAGIYCRGQRRAFAVGFVIFSFGYWICYWLIIKTTGGATHMTPAVGIVLTLQPLLRASQGFTSFYHIFNFALTMLLGFVGGLIATLLYAEPRQPTGRQTSTPAPP